MPKLRIKRDMNFVLPLTIEEHKDQNGKTTFIEKMYVHSVPISLQVFNEYSMVLAKTFTAIQVEGLGNVSGPRVAAQTLMHVAKDMNVEDIVRQGLMGEIRRLTNVSIPADKGGWENMMLEDMIRGDYLDDEDIQIVENALVFFMLSWRMYPPEYRTKMVVGAAMLWGGFTTSLNFTEYANSLPTSKPVEITKKRPVGSLVPS